VAEVEAKISAGGLSGSVGLILVCYWTKMQGCVDAITIAKRAIDTIARSNILIYIQNTCTTFNTLIRGSLVMLVSAPTAPVDSEP
jgi:hypothetical protein